MARAKYEIEQAGGDPGALQRSQQRALHAIGKDIDELRAYSTTLDAASWTAPAPTTQAEAIARLAVAVQGILGGTIP